MNTNSILPKKEICMRSEGILCAYVHIPFCRTLCSFCCWCRSYEPSEILAIDTFRQPYLDALKKEKVLPASLWNYRNGR
jgi:coproporphyrinogen III oxidase-like Fe-S oxidoreductase